VCSVLIPIGTSDIKHPDDVEPSYFRRLRRALGRRHAGGGCPLVFNDETWLAGIGTFIARIYTWFEKFKRVDYNTIQYEATIEGP